LSELSSIYTANDRRVDEIRGALDRYTKDAHDVRALGFCATIEHAKYMAGKFTLAGYNAAYLTSENSNVRYEIREKLRSKILTTFLLLTYSMKVSISQK
jgi:superfamily II DNA or RNA helicase